jgi:predicted transcriptional regulator with HTH domain
MLNLLRPIITTEFRIVSKNNTLVDSRRLIMSSSPDNKWCVRGQNNVRYNGHGSSSSHPFSLSKIFKDMLNGYQDYKLSYREADAILRQFEITYSEEDPSGAIYPRECLIKDQPMNLDKPVFVRPVKAPVQNF